MKKALSFILAAIMIFGTLPAMSLFSTAADIPVTGTWTRGTDGGDYTTMMTDGSTGGYVDIDWNAASDHKQVYYTLVSGVLTVYGTGELSGTNAEFPWYSHKDSITKIVIAPGFTSLGSGVFSNYGNVTDVVIGEGVTSIGGDCFAYMDRLTTITFPSTLTSLGQGVTWGSGNISTVYLAPGFDYSTINKGAYNDNTDNTSKHVFMNYTPIDCKVWGSENWTGSPNKGDEEAVFQFLVTLENNGADVIPFAQTNDYTWKLTISCGNYGKTIEMAPATSYSTMRRFEVCLGQGDNQFIPIKGCSYTIQVDICDKTTGAVLYRSDAQSGFGVNVEPIVPQDNGTVFFVNGSCYMQCDLGSSMPVKSVKLVNYVDSGRYYKWRIYGTNDLSTPISQWTYLGGKMNTDVSTADGYTQIMAVNGQSSYDSYQYLRIYGVQNSANGGYHFSEAAVTSYSATLSYPITFVIDGTSYNVLVEDGETPVCPVSTDKAPDYLHTYTFTGWDTPIVPATAAATYTAQYSSAIRSARVVNLNGWAGFENWGSPTNTQWLYEINGSDADFATECSVLKANNFQNFRWKFTIAHEENGETITEVHNMKPWSTITNDHNFRLRPMDQDDAFYPVQGVEYTVVGLDVYDMTLTSQFGAEGYHLYTNGSNTKSYTNSSAPTHMGEAKALSDFYTITWTLDGVTVGTTKVLPGKTPTYPGDPIPTEKTENGVNYILSSPVIAAASGDATYAYRYVRADGKVTISWVDATDASNNYSAEFDVGATAVYAGTAAEHMGADGYTWYTPVIEGNNTTAAEDVTYQITWNTKDTRQLGIGKYSNGIENWGGDGQTQFLVILSQDGGDFNVNIADYDWEITINGTPFNMAPSTKNGLWGSGYLYRFRPAVGEVFVPQAGQGNEYVVSVKLYQNNELKYYTPDTVTLVTPEDFVPVHEHSYTWVTGTAATCTEDGVENGTCSVCGGTTTRAIAATGHTPVVDAAVAPTCTETGLTEGSHCSVCNAVLTAQEVVPATGHTWGDWAVTTAATCTEAGVETRTCSVCGATETRALAAAGHTPVVDAAVAPTCTETGLTEGSHCSVCNAVLTAQEVVPATGHTWGDWAVTTAATCTEAGVETRTCSVCGATETRALAATGHTPVVDAAVAPTCTETGLTEGSYCSVCNEVLTAQEEVPATGHTWNAGEVTTAATCGADGVKTYTCSACGATTTEAIPATGEHTYGEPVITWNGYAASASHTCSACGTVEAMPVTVTYAITTASTCTATGTLTYTATVDGTAVTSTKDATLAKLAHTFGADGICTVCGAEAVGYSTTPKAIEEKDFMAIRYKDIWQYRVSGEEEYDFAAPEGWLNGTDNAAWSTGRGGIGAKSWGSWNTRVDVQLYRMYLRKTFTVTDKSQVTGLKFYFLYDQDPVIYLNGTQVLSLSGYVDNRYVMFSFDEYIDLLVNGTNYLCIDIQNSFGGGGCDAALSIHCDHTKVNHNMITKGSVWEFAYTDNDSNAAAPNGYIAGNSVADIPYGEAPFTIPAYHDLNNDSAIYTILPGSTMTTWFRQFFDVADASAVSTLKMELKYDEDPIVYLNGTQVYTATGYHDWGYVTVDLAEYKNLLVDGENCVVVRMVNAAGGGGSVFDMSLDVYAYYDENGKIAPASASCNGFVGFGAINAPTNILDGDQTTVCGSGFDAAADQYVRIDFAKHEIISQIFLQCKDEGTTPNADGTRGTYDVYALQDGIETLIAQNVPAKTGTDGGYTITLGTPVKADGVIVRIASWQGSAWACVADLIVTPAVYVYGHVYSAWTVTAEPTCTDAGSRTRTCEDCSEADPVEAIDALGHVWGDWATTTTPGFLNDGVSTRTCSVCGATENEAIPAVHLGGYETVLVGESDGKNTATFVGTIVGDGFDPECVDGIVVTLVFKQNGNVVKTVANKQIHGIYSTITGVATVDESTAASQGTILVEDANYLYAITLRGIPAGDYTLEVTAQAYKAESEATYPTFSTTYEFTV